MQDGGVFPSGDFSDNLPRIFTIIPTIFQMVKKKYKNIAKTHRNWVKNSC